MKNLLATCLIILTFESKAAINIVNENFDRALAKAQNQSLNMDVRWSAVMNAASLASGEEMLKVVKLSKNSDWFIRNAVLVALDKNGNDMSYDVAKQLVTDKSLVVRSAAVDILSRLKTDEVKNIFSTELDKKYNMNGSSSLWIRRQMMTHLVDNSDKNEKVFFVKYLFDSSPEIARLSALALEKMTQVRFSGSDDKDVVNQWKKYARNQKW